MIKFIKRLILKLFKKQGCYYINGPDTLRPPLTKEEEEKPITLKDIIDMVNNLSTDDIEKLGQYCNGTAMYRNVLETIQ